MYTSSQIALLLNITDETIRARSKEFSAFLSPSANPPRGRQRGYSENDLRVLTLVNSMKNEGARFDDIHLALRNGQVGELPEHLNTSALATQERGRVAILQSQLAEWQQVATQETRNRYAAEAKVELLKEQLAEAQAKIDRIMGENAVLRSKASDQ